MKCSLHIACETARECRETQDKLLDSDIPRQNKNYLFAAAKGRDMRTFGRIGVASICVWQIGSSATRYREDPITGKIIQVERIINAMRYRVDPYLAAEWGICHVVRTSAEDIERNGKQQKFLLRHDRAVGVLPGHELTIALPGTVLVRLIHAQDFLKNPEKHLGWMKEEAELQNFVLDPG